MVHFFLQCQEIKKIKTTKLSRGFFFIKMEFYGAFCVCFFAVVGKVEGCLRCKYFLISNAFLKFAFAPIKLILPPSFLHTHTHVLASMQCLFMLCFPLFSSLSSTATYHYDKKYCDMILPCMGGPYTLHNRSVLFCALVKLKRKGETYYHSFNLFVEMFILFMKHG